MLGRSLTFAFMTKQFPHDHIASSLSSHTDMLFSLFFACFPDPHEPGTSHTRKLNGKIWLNLKIRVMNKREGSQWKVLSYKVRKHILEPRTQPTSSRAGFLLPGPSPANSPPLTVPLSKLSLAVGADRWASIGYARILGLFHHTPSCFFQNWQLYIYNGFPEHAVIFTSEQKQWGTHVSKTERGTRDVSWERMAPDLCMSDLGVKGTF